MSTVWIVANADFPEGRGGTPRIRNVAVGLHERGHQVRVLLPHAAGLVATGQNLRVQGTVHDVPFEFLNGAVDRPARDRAVVGAKLLGNLKLCARYLKGPRPDVVLIYNYSLLDTGLLIAVSKLARTLVIYDVCDERHQLHAVGHPQSLARWINALHFRASDALTLRAMDGMLVVSEYLRALTQARHPRVPWLRVPLVADMRRSVTSEPVTRARDRAEFAYVGSLIADEGIDMLVEALLMLRERYPGARCHLYGDFNSESYRDSLHRMLVEKQACDVLVFHGNTPWDWLVTEVSDKYAMVLPRPDSVVSRAGFPGKLAEYLASRRPLVTTRFGDIERYFTNGEDAFMSDTTTARSFAAAMEHALHDPARATQVGQNGYRLGMRLFDIRGVAEQIEEFLHGIRTRAARNAPAGPVG